MQLYDTLSLATIDSSFAVEYVDAPMRYHYYDCTCDTCKENHRFYCGDQTCQYCAIIGDMLVNGTITDPSQAISLLEFESLGDAEITQKEMVIYRCVDCKKRITYVEWKIQDTCEERCATCLESAEEEEEEEDETFYCRACEEEEVSEEDDICEYCGQHGYVEDEDNWAYIQEAWIAPNGDLYYVSSDCGGHENAARVMGFSGVDACENAGYIHLTDAYGCSFEYVPSNYTSEQVATVMTLCEIKEWEYPEFIEEYLSRGTVQEDKAITDDSVKMQNLNPSWLSMPRRNRDIFYPLSGD